jgi:hypothetical protein
MRETLAKFTSPSSTTRQPTLHHFMPDADKTSLQITVLTALLRGSPPDSCYDGSVTSLDALMILQAAAGSIEIG